MRWKYLPVPDNNEIQHLSEALTVHPAIAMVLLQRGIKTYDQAKAFFRPVLTDLHDPFLMKDMDKATERLSRAIKQREKIMVFGDYDVDGTTSVALMSSFLKDKNIPYEAYVPDRETEGYGISLKGIDTAVQSGCSLMIALDCGIRAVKQAEYARQQGIDLIICDHHSPGDQLPDAVAVLDPKRPDCEYPYKGLSGCGVGFKLIQALYHKEDKGVEALIPYLDLVAVSIAADIVPLTGENRILAFHGLKRLNENPRPGLAKLKEVSGKKQLNITDVVFMIAPRINAAGRMAHAKIALQTLMSEDKDSAEKPAEMLNELNTSRQQLDERITSEALAQIEQQDNTEAYTSVVYDANWHKGVIGIVASRLIETYYRPTVVFTRKGDFLTGSARSVQGFDLYAALRECDSFIEQWGGHKYAAGLTLKPNNLQAFKEAFESVVRRTMPPELRHPEIRITSEIDPREIDMKFYRIIEQMAPFGPGNMRPVFSASGLRDNGYGKAVGEHKNHLKIQIITGAGHRTLDAIGFNLGHLEPLIRNAFKIAFTIDVNTWNGYTNLQLKVKDIQKD
jgi:single-stranded-DNA-specific exonuclease